MEISEAKKLRSSLRKIYRRWKIDAETVSALLSPDKDWESDFPELEVYRNLETAIVQLEMVICGLTNTIEDKP